MADFLRIAIGLTLGAFLVWFGWQSFLLDRDLSEEREADEALEKARREWAKSIESYEYREPELHLTEAQAERIMAKIFPDSPKWNPHRRHAVAGSGDHQRGDAT